MFIIFKKNISLYEKNYPTEKHCKYNHKKTK